MSYEQVDGGQLPVSTAASPKSDPVRDDIMDQEAEKLVQVRSNSRRTWRHYWATLSALCSAGGKPPSNPNGWPNPREEDLNERPSRIIKIGGEQVFSFRNNFVKTSKYELWDFPGKFLLEEFNPYTKVANCYFLMISAMQCIPQISNTNGYPTTLIPLLFIIFVDAVFQLLEDSSRHRADRAANSSTAYRLDAGTGQFVPCRWHEVAVGDFLRVENRSIVPADIVVLSVAEKTEPAQGLCYVETKSLDGETNLKIKTALPGTLAVVRHCGVLYCTVLNMYRFHY